MMRRRTGRAEAEPDDGWRHDAAAFAGLVRRWQRPVGRFLQRIVGDGEQVQDLCQDVFLRVYLARGRYRQADAFSTWLFQIALNVARDFLRRRGHHWQPLEDVESIGEGPDGLTEQRETAAMVSGAVAALPPELREVIALRHDQGMSFEQMSRILGVPASTLKSRFSAALHRLSGRLAALATRPEEI